MSAAALFTQGRSLATQQRHAEALDFLTAAADKTLNDPTLLYTLAYCQRGVGEIAVAAETLSKAVQLERERKNVDWSSLMENYQGPARAWLETERRKLLIGQPK